MTTSEVWKEIPGWEGYYKVSNLGNVSSMDRVINCLTNRGAACKRRLSGRPLASRKDEANKSIVVHLSDVERFIDAKSYTVCSLMLLAFVGPRPEGGVPGHLDGDSYNNDLSNLKWVTHSEACLLIHERKKCG